MGSGEPEERAAAALEEDGLEGQRRGGGRHRIGTIAVGRVEAMGVLIDETIVIADLLLVLINCHGHLCL